MNSTKIKVLLGLWNLFEIAYLAGFTAMVPFLHRINTPLATGILITGGALGAAIKACDATVTKTLNDYIEYLDIKQRAANPTAPGPA